MAYFTQPYLYQELLESDNRWWHRA